MEERTLLLLRALQTAERTDAGLAGVRAMLTEERPGLRAFEDRATLADASELLEVWSEAAPPHVAAGALALAGDIAEQDLQQLERALQLYQRSLELAPTQLATLDALQRGLTSAGRSVEFEPMLAAHIDRMAASEGLDPELLAQQLRRLGALRDAASDGAGAIAAYERAVEHSADPELVRELAEAYARRSAPGDGTQAAELFTMLAEVLGPPEAGTLIERALDLAPGSVAALTALEAATPEAERASKLLSRWERFVDSADDEEAIDARRPLLARAYLAAGREKAALTCIGPLVDRGDAAAAELQAECLAALRAHEATPSGEAKPATNEVPREPTLVGFRLPRTSSVPPAEAGPDGEPVAGGAVRKPDSGVHKRPAPRSGGTLVGFRLSEETLAALKAQEAAEASIKARAQVEAAQAATSESPERSDAAASTSASGTASASADAPVPSEAAAAPSASAASAPSALSPAEHAARLRRSSAPPPAMKAETSKAREPAPAKASTSAARPGRAQAPTPRASTRPSSTRPSSARPSSARSSSDSDAPAARPRPSSGPVARPSAAPALSPAQLAQSLRSSASSPPPARNSSAELPSASAAAAHAAALRRSSPGSMPAPAPRASAAPSPSHSHASSAAAAASAHAAVLRRSSAGTFAGATAMNMPAEENVLAAAAPVLSAVAPPVAHEEPRPEPIAQHALDATAVGAEDTLPANAELAHAEQHAGAAHADAGEYTEASAYTEDATHDASASAASDTQYDHGLAAAPAASVPPPLFGVGPSTMPDLAGALGGEPSRSGSSRKPMVIGAVALLGIGAAVALFGGGKKSEPPSTVAEPSAPSAATAPTAAAPTAPAAPTTTAATPTPTPTAAAADPNAATAPAAPPSALPGDLAAAVAPGTGAATTGATGPAAAPTQDEKTLGKVELAGAAKIRGGVKLRPKDVAAGVKEQLPALERCYTETLEDKPKAAGELTFGFTIGRTGKPTAVKKLSGTLKDAGLARCATNALGEARFDKQKRPAKVTLPLRFTRL